MNSKTAPVIKLKPPRRDAPFAGGAAPRDEAELELEDEIEDVIKELVEAGVRVVVGGLCSRLNTLLKYALISLPVLDASTLSVADGACDV